MISYGYFYYTWKVRSSLVTFLHTAYMGSHLVCSCIIQLSSCCDKILDTPNLKERLILAHNFRGLSPWLAGFKTGTSRQKGLAEHSCSLHGGREAEHRRGVPQTYLPYASSELPPTEPHLLPAHSAVNSSRFIH